MPTSRHPAASFPACRVCRALAALATVAALACLLPACGGSGGTPSPTSPTELQQTRETAHFSIHYQATDASCIDAVTNVLEGNHQRVCADLRVALDFKPAVRIYPDLTTFHQAIGSPNAADWVVGLTNLSGEIKIVSPLRPGPQHTYDSILQALVHEFVHAVVLRGIGATALPMWLQEGVASYEAGQMNEAAWAGIGPYVTSNRIPSFADLGDRSRFADLGGYAWSYTILDFAVTTYGRDTLRPWIDNGGAFEATFGVTEAAFRARWIEYLEARCQASSGS